MNLQGNRQPSNPDTIQVHPVGAADSELAYRPYIVVSLALATLVGFVLGIHVPLGRLLDSGSSDRTADLVQAHGQVQLLGFAGLYVMGMSYRLMPRFAGSRIALEGLVPWTLSLIAASLLLRAVVMPWFAGDAHSALLLASVVGVLAGSACFLLIVAATLAVDARRFDASSLSFILGALLLFAASDLSLLVAIDAVSSGFRTIPYLADNAILQLQLGGFLFLFILGVATRAVPSMVGVERPGRSASLAAIALAGIVAIYAAALLYLEYGSYSGTVVRLAGLALLLMGGVLLMLVWMAGILRPVANRIRPSSRPNLWLLRSAFVWLVTGALIALYAGGSAITDGDFPTQFELDALRHALGLGVLTNLIVGMSLMILPEFAVERQGANWQRPVALGLAVLLNLSTVLRVLPALAGSSWSTDDRNLSMAVAGTLAEVALLAFAFTLLRLLLGKSAARPLPSR